MRHLKLSTAADRSAHLHARIELYFHNFCSHNDERGREREHHTRNRTFLRIIMGVMRTRPFVCEANLTNMKF